MVLIVVVVVVLLGAVDICTVVETKGCVAGGSSKMVSVSSGSSSELSITCSVVVSISSE